MARIRSLTQSASQSKVHPTEVDAEWALIDAGGQRLFQLSTFGSDERMSLPKVSQTIQLDRATAKELMSAVTLVFPDLGV
ncbi:hypothetical protein FHX76_002686 [Lysinibacter cavernae]|uniref:Uncharacterized protein n=1 Tax=Lysinibacter cavernae TaxID=1640652 RepID=A0A7X5TU19_9MICO|nr:hypothetical protein [Lysinibacter cavernae]